MASSFESSAHLLLLQQKNDEELMWSCYNSWSIPIFKYHTSVLASFPGQPCLSAYLGPVVTFELKSPVPPVSPPPCWCREHSWLLAFPPPPETIHQSINNVSYVHKTAAFQSDISATFASVRWSSSCLRLSMEAALSSDRLAVTESCFDRLSHLSVFSFNSVCRVVTCKIYSVQNYLKKDILHSKYALLIHYGHSFI